MDKKNTAEIKAIAGEKTDKKDDKISTKIAIKELEENIQKMVEDRDKKCEAAKKQLIDMLEVTVDKYRTATGTAEALRVLRFVYSDDYAGVHQANELAFIMAKVTDEMRQKAEKLGYAEMDQICDGFYEKQLDLEPYDYDEGEMKLAEEMMRIDLCRNVGGSAEDMVEFINRVQDEINQANEKLAELKKEN